MTYRQVILEKEPDKVDKKYVGGVYGCPRDGRFNLVMPGYCWAKNRTLMDSTPREEKNKTCRKCWGRQVKL